MKIKVTVDFVLEIDDLIRDPENLAVQLFNEGYWGDEAILVKEVVPYEEEADNVELRHQVRIQAAELETEL